MMYRNVKPLTSGFVRKLGNLFHCDICKCCVQGPPNDNTKCDHDHKKIEEMKPEDLLNVQEAVIHHIDDTLKTNEKPEDLEVFQSALMEVIGNAVDKENMPTDENVL